MATPKIEDAAFSEIQQDHDDCPMDGEQEAVDEEARCKYPSKFCGRARARKSNGTFHRFCQYHRLKANTNQKRWTSVRREQAALEEQHRRRIDTFAAAPMAFPMFDTDAPAPHWVPGLLPDPVSLDRSPEPVGLAVEDVHILNALFIGEAPHDCAQPQYWNYYEATQKQPFAHCDISL